MKVSFSQTKAGGVKSDAVILFFYEDDALIAAQKLAITAEFPSTESIFSAGDFKGKRGTTALHYCGAKSPSSRLIFVGLGKEAEVTLEQIRRAAAKAARQAASLKIKSIALPLIDSKIGSAEEIAHALIEGATLSLYKYDKYFADADKKQHYLDSIALYSEDKKAITAAKSVAETVIELCNGVILARDLANAPSNEIYPETLGKRAVEAGKSAGFKTTIFEKKKIQSLKMNGLLAVNFGSARPPVFIVMEYNGGKKGDKPVVLVGKGITFDTGGISLKPGEKMGDMRGDMHGSATVIGTMYAVAKAKLPINVVGLVPATDNMPSGTAQNPGDVIVYSNGKSVEVDNTDAEGRLVLADALIYADRYKPQAVVDLATLTGACVVALGNITTGLMGTGEELKARIKASAVYTHEHVCELPLYDEYEDLIKSDYADIKNTGGRGGGAITAGMFLKKFIGDYPWAHLDIAGTAILPSETAYMPKGCSGIGVRLLFDMLKKWK